MDVPREVTLSMPKADMRFAPKAGDEFSMDGSVWHVRARRLNNR
jgi:hypothetical protein